MKGTWSVHSFNGDYLSIPVDTGSCGYLFHEIPGISEDGCPNAMNLLAVFSYLVLYFFVSQRLISLKVVNGYSYN